MFSVYDLACNNLRDARGVCEPVRLSWRLGSDRLGARQASYRIVVTSMTDGACRWDTGEVASSQNLVEYGGEALLPGETCVWFVSVTDDAGNRADGVPSAFTCARKGERETSDAGMQRLGFLWTSDAGLNDRLDKVSATGCLDDAVWQDVAGISWASAGRGRVAFCPHETARRVPDLRFSQASVLLPRGLVVARWERRAGGLRSELSLPPGMYGVVNLCDRTCEVSSGRYVWVDGER